MKWTMPHAANVVLVASLMVVVQASSQNHPNQTEPAPMSASSSPVKSKMLEQLCERYFEELLVLSPLYATYIGDHRYDDRLGNEISDEHRRQKADMADKYSRELARLDRVRLDPSDQLTYDVLRSDLTRVKESLRFPDHWLPIGTMDDLPTMFALLGSGNSIQPFKTVQDYDKFLGRVRDFSKWVDTAILNMRRGMISGVVQPRIIVEKSAAQMEGLLTPESAKSVFYQPIQHMPAHFSEADKTRISQAYITAIDDQIQPSYRKLVNFIRQEYLPKCRDSIGYSDLPDGRGWYQQQVRHFTTTDLTPDQIFKIGLSEVARINREMEKLISKTGYAGDLAGFAPYLDKTAVTYRTKEDLVNGYTQLRAIVEPNLPRLFGHLPKAPFEIRPVEVFREKTSQSQLQPASPDGTRPAIFYVNAQGIETTPMSLSESLFIHEALPGHHLQVAIAFEDGGLPRFRRFAWYDAYGDGWALYAESLGPELGLYRDAKQNLDFLASEMFRARRLVVDVGLHLKGWTRDQAIKYLMETPGTPESDAILEVDRYIGWPGQALSYKCGQLKIKALRTKAEKTLGSKFDIRAFHDEMLTDGCLPLDVLEAKLDRWINAQSKY